MSAISVAWTKSTDPPARLFHEKILAAQSIYGAGKASFWAGEHIALGGVLSNLLPEDHFDTQPLWSSDKSCCLVADVRLDNRADLARELSLTHPEELADSTVLMAAWQRWGPSCLDHIIGAFAFAVWTPSRQELFAARDHAGERTLFYHRTENLFALASMPQGLLALPGISREFNQPQLADWLAGTPSGLSGNFFTAIQRVPPGHFLQVTAGSFVCRQYWHPANAAPIRYKKDEDYAEALLEIFDRATEARLRTTRPVGSLLSAGLDCSSVTATAARLLAAQGKSLTAFTAVPRPDFNGISQPWHISNEGSAAAEVAQLYPNIQHVLVDTTGYDLLATMKLWTDASGEPARNVINLVWFKAILDQARQRGIGVMLEGGAGNGTISWSSLAILPHLFRHGRWIKFFKTARSLRGHGETSIHGAMQLALAGLLPAKIRQRLNQPLGMTDEQSLFFEQGDSGAVNAAAQAIAGIEFRDPTADKRIYDFCFSIPPEQSIVGGHSRSLIRRAMRGRLPQSTLSRYSRGHQGADWYLSIQDALPSLRTEVALQQQSSAVSHTIDLPRMQSLLDTWPTSGYEQKSVYIAWHNALMQGISMGYFLRSNESAAAALPAAQPTAPLLH